QQLRRVEGAAAENDLAILLDTDFPGRSWFLAGRLGRMIQALSAQKLDADRARGAGLVEDYLRYQAIGPDDQVVGVFRLGFEEEFTGAGAPAALDVRRRAILVNGRVLAADR